MAKETFSERLADAMRKEGLKGPVQLGKRVKVNKQTASKWINGKTLKLSADDLYKLANGLNVAARWLWTGEGPILQRAAISFEEEQCLAIYRTLPTPWREDWVQTGLKIIERLRLPPSAINPYPKVKVK